ncbi:cytochrome P450 [Rhizoctonia solani]|nr:cytochrome P450 [Rhizoctonia solani]
MTAIDFVYSPGLFDCYGAIVLVLGILLVLFTLICLRYQTQCYRYLPPSPPKHWFWGNKDLVNQPYKYVTMGTQYKDTLGDIITIITPFTASVTVNTIEVATELLEKHAALTANRPRNVMIQELLGWSDGVAFRVHDEWHKKQRRILASALHSTAARSYELQHLGSTINLLRRISSDPNLFQKYISDVVGDFIIELAYGYAARKDDPLLATTHQAFLYMAKASMRYFVVNDFPILKYLPEWFPGAAFQEFGREGREHRDRYVNGLFETVVRQMRGGEVEKPSYTSRLLEAKGGANVTNVDLELVKWTAASLFTGKPLESCAIQAHRLINRDALFQGVPPRYSLQAVSHEISTVGLIWSFILMVSLYPETAKLARDEIDTIVGRDRIPELKDRDSMPYMEALLQEVMRLCPVGPLGIPHITTQDIMLGGYRIPKNTTINPNIWAMLRDPKHFSSPHTFDPSRYLKPVPDPDPRKFVFGFGRRVCPGQHVANNTAWIMCAGILSVFDLQPGGELLEKVEQLGGRESMALYKLFKPYLVYDLYPFSCNFVLRDQAAQELLRNSIP